MEERFTYDLLDRLTGVVEGLDTTGVFAYDAYGRMTSKYLHGAMVFDETVYNADGRPHAVKLARMYSPQPDMSMGYTSFDKLRNVRTGNLSLTYGYGYEHQRLSMVETFGNDTIKTKEYVGNCEFVTEDNGTYSTSYSLTYLSGPLGVFAVRDTRMLPESKRMYYVHPDHLGSWTTVTAWNGRVVQDVWFDPWGTAYNNPSGSEPSPAVSLLFDRGFTSHEHLMEFGLINMNGRMYDPVMSCFLSVDNYVQDPSCTQNFNRYAYCRNNPLRYVDPSGWLAGGGNTGYFPNSTSNAFDPYMFYGHTALEPRDLGLRELSTADPIITWMEENSLHASGNGAKDNCDLPIIDPSNLTSSQKESLDNILSFAQKNSDLFNKLFSCLFDSKTVYSLIIGPTSNNVPAQYNPEDNTIVFRDEESLIVIKAIVEEFFHAYQLSENKSLYGSEEFNYEFEAKVAVFLIVEQLIGLHENANGTNFERMYSFIAPNGIDVIMPTTQSIQETPFLKDYYEAAEFFRKWNIDNHYGNINYRARTAQTPKSLFELFKP